MTIFRSTLRVPPNGLISGALSNVSQVPVNYDGSAKKLKRTLSAAAMSPVSNQRTPVQATFRGASPSASSASSTASDRPRTVRFQDNQAAVAPELAGTHSPRRRPRTPTKIPHNDPNEVSVAERYFSG